MSFIFAEPQGMQSAAAKTADLAADTASAGGQVRVGGVVVPPGLDSVSLANSVKINSYTSEVAAQLAAGSGLQVNYGESISGSAAGYGLTDELNAAGLSV